MEKNEKEKVKNKINKELLIKIIILIILLILIAFTSFRTGQKFFILKNTYFGDSSSDVETKVARWNFSARVIQNEKE